MEFVNRKSCIEHYHSQFPNLPRYMIEMALDYDLQNGGASSEKPMTGAQKRKAKKVKAQQPERNTTLRDALRSGELVEIDGVRVIPQEEFQQAPFVEGYISLDGMAVQKGADAEKSQEFNLGLQ
jgi:hypothetical protein